jgi:hypothetical protein
MTAAAAVAVAASPTVILLNIDESIVYGIAGVITFTCVVVCVHIILGCATREHRLANLRTRLLRRANARADSEERRKHLSQP